MESIKRAFSLALIFTAFAFSAEAQSFDEYLNQTLAEFDSFKKKSEAEFEAFRDKANAEFAALMGQTWREEQTKPPVPQPSIPEPPTPAVAEPDVEPTNDPIPVVKVTPKVEPQSEEKPKPIVPIAEEQSVPQRASFAFDYYGTRCGINIDESHKFTLGSTKERDVAKAWKTLSDDKYNDIINEALSWRTALELSDWGYVTFLREFAQAYFGAAAPAEAIVTQMYILSQSGYDARIARSNDNLYILLPIQAQVYDYPYLSIDGTNYFVIEDEGSNSSFAVFDNKFPQSQSVSLVIEQEPKLDVKATSPRSLVANLYPETAVSIAINRNLIDFYNDYPRNNNWNIYAQASLSQRTKDMLYPTLKKSIAGKSNIQAVNIILNFVQTAFEYQTDDEQFGVERPLFAEETLFYPYCDCEDRSILFATIVGDLLSLDVVLLHYPEHLATAVAIGDNVSGDYVTLNGEKYLVCDPTYIGAKAGIAMPALKSAKVEIITI